MADLPLSILSALPTEKISTSIYDSTDFKAMAENSQNQTRGIGITNTKNDVNNTRVVPSDSKKKPVVKKQQKKKVIKKSQGSPAATPKEAEFSGVDASAPDSFRQFRELDDGEERIASISLVSEKTAGALTTQDAKGNLVSFIDKEKKLVSSYSRFLLQSVREAQAEKFQIVETFTSFYAFFFGKRPPIYNYTGILLNDANHKWINDFMFFYENFFRGTRATELNTQAMINYDGRLVTGFVIDISMQEDSVLPKGVPFSINVLVTDHKLMNFSPDIQNLITTTRANIAKKSSDIYFFARQMNKNVPTGKMLEFFRTLNGKENYTNVKDPEKKETANPVSTQNPETAINAEQKALLFAGQV